MYVVSVQLICVVWYLHICVYLLCVQQLCTVRETNEKLGVKNITENVAEISAKYIFAQGCICTLRSFPIPLHISIFQQLLTFDSTDIFFMQFLFFIYLLFN